MITLNELQKKVEKGISDYIEFDINKIFEQSDYIAIYGGAVRDSIAGLEIHDVDILCMPESAAKLKPFLIESGFKQVDLYDQESLDMYREISVISEPWTFINCNMKIIQIIRPALTSRNNPTKIEYYNLIKNVDISSCGVFLENYDRKVLLRESCKDALVHCLSRIYSVNKWSTFYNPNRTFMREQKLSKRGWINLEHHRFTNQQQRLLKLNKIEFKSERDYKIWTEEEYLNKIDKIEKMVSIDLDFL